MNHPEPTPSNSQTPQNEESNQKYPKESDGLDHISLRELKLRNKDT